MNKITEQYKKLKKEDRIMFFLIFTTIGNIFIALAKFLLSLILPSLFFINAYTNSVIRYLC